MRLSQQAVVVVGDEGKRDLQRLTVVLDEALLEHVRVRAFEKRKSRSAYVRELVERDARCQVQETESKGASA